MQQKLWSQMGAVQLGTSAQLLLSHLIASGGALGVFSLAVGADLKQPVPLVLAMATAALLGLLLTTNIQYNLYLIEITLTRFMKGFPIDTFVTLWRWPLSSLFAQMNILSQRLKEFSHNQQQSIEFREQLLHQAGEAAALGERNRIARELHDSIKQQIFSISVSAAAAKAHWDGNAADAREAVEDIQRTAKEIQVEMQALLQQLRPAPLENTSLVEALHMQAQALEYRTGARVLVDVNELPTHDRLPPATQETLFRMVQEAFANIARHARASTIWLKLYVQGDALHMEVRDDGQGFASSTTKKGMGLANLQERAKTLGGTLDIQSTVGQGTAVHTVIPLLDTLDISQERAQLELETKRAIEQAKRGFQFGENAAPLAFVLMIANLIVVPASNISSINISSITIGAGLCFCATIYGYLQGYFYRVRVALYTGNTSVETLALRQREQELRLYLVRLSLFAVWYFYSLLQSWSFLFSIWMPIGITVVLAGLVFVVRKQVYAITEDYYRLLPPLDARWEIEQKRRAVIRRLRLLAVTALALLIAGSLSFHFPPTTPRDWFSYYILTGIVVWGLLMSLDYIFVRHWKQMLVVSSSTEASQLSHNVQEVQHGR